VVANVRGRSLGAVTDEVKDRLKNVTFPREHHLEVLGDSQAQAATDLKVWTYAIGAAILIFFVLQAALGGWLIATLYFLCLPVALSGGVLVGVLTRDSVSVVALLGLLTVLTVAVRGGLLQIKQYQRLHRESAVTGEELVLLGSRQRFTPAVT